MRRRDIAWGGFAQILNIGSGLLILPFILRLLSAADVGLWFAFLALAGLVQLLELGFQPTIARAAAYVYAGAQDLQSEGLDHQTAAGDVRLDLLGDLVQASRYIYRIVSILAAIALFFAGSIYIYSIVGNKVDLSNAMVTWWMIAAGSVFNFYFGYYNALLQGRGDVTESNKAIVYSKLIYLFISITLLIMDFGLISIGFATLVSVISGRILIRYYYLSTSELKSSQSRFEPNRHKELLKKIWPNAKKLGLTNLGAFLILRGNTLVATTFLGLEAAASYGLAIQLLQALSGVANMPLALQMPRMNKCQVEKNMHGLAESVGLVVFFGLLIYVLGAVLLITAGSSSLSLVGSKTHLPPQMIILFLSIIFGLELHHSLFASYLTTFNAVPFVRSALISGIFICLFSIYFVANENLGIMGLVVAQGSVQLAYNNWKWPLEGLKTLRIGWLELVSNGASKFMKVARGQ